MTDKQVTAISDIIREEIDTAMTMITHRIAETFTATSSEVAIEKMKPRNIQHYDRNRWMGYCPACSWNNGAIFQPVIYSANYCSNCGQPLDWSEVDEFKEEMNEHGSQSNISTREISENYSTGHQR